MFLGTCKTLSGWNEDIGINEVFNIELNLEAEITEADTESDTDCKSQGNR